MNDENSSDEGEQANSTTQPEPEEQNVPTREGVAAPETDRSERQRTHRITTIGVAVAVAGVLVALLVGLPNFAPYCTKWGIKPCSLDDSPPKHIQQDAGTSGPAGTVSATPGDIPGYQPLPGGRSPAKATPQQPTRSATPSHVPTGSVATLPTSSPAAGEIAIPNSGCDKEPNLRSTSSAESTTLSFYNQRPQEIKIYWLDPDGARQFQTSLSIRGHVTFQTRVLHIFVVTDSGGSCLGVFAAHTYPGKVLVN